MMTQNYFVSTITAPHGIFTNVSNEFRDINNIIIKICIESPNTLNVMFIFDNTAFTEKEAKDYSLQKIESLALELALKHTLNFSWNPNFKSVWSIEQGKVQTLTTITGQASIARAIELDLNVHYVRDDLLDSLRFFNTALQYKEQPQREREIALWLDLSWEALRLLLGGEHQTKKILEDNSILDKNELKDFKYAIGEYYRHVKGKGHDKALKLISLGECVKTMGKVLQYFNQNSGE
jgi:hypothetical protein